MDRYEIFKKKQEAGTTGTTPPAVQWYFRLVGKNNKIVAQSEGYNRRMQAIRAVDRIRQIAQTTVVVENLGRGAE